MVVIGAGPVGRLAAECTHALGAPRLFLGVHRTRIEIPEGLGNEVPGFGLPDPIDRFRSAHPASAHIVPDTAGIPDTIRATVKLFAFGDHYVAV